MLAAKQYYSICTNIFLLYNISMRWIHQLFGQVLSACQPVLWLQLSADVHKYL